MIEEKAFGEARLFTLTNGDLSVSVSSRGATVTSLRYHGRETVLGYESDEMYLRGGSYLGATVGRVGNRIGGAAFTLNGQRYDLAANEGPTSSTAAREPLTGSSGRRKRSPRPPCASPSVPPTGKTAIPGIWMPR